jgi:hypothetical protein
MTWQDAALALAGVIGSGVAVIHGVLTQRLLVTPFANAFRTTGGISAIGKKLVPSLLQFSTFNWFHGGLCLDCRCTLVRTRCKGRNRSARWQLLFVWCAHRPLGDARSPSGLDALRGRARPNNIWR